MINDDYKKFIAAKSLTVERCGFEVLERDINSMLFDWQNLIVRWALRLGRAAIFADCGLGKTPMQLEWANQVCKQTGGKVLLLAPLAVSHQTKREGAKFGIDATICNTQADVKPGINITNYEKLEHFTASEFVGIVLDESSILKSYSGSTRNQIIEMFANTPYRLACTATPSPNDYMELGNHAEFVGIMTRVEMLAMFFTHDGGDTAKWRLRGHGAEMFWKWLSEWAIVIRKPSDLGFEDDGFALPELNFHPHVVDGGIMDGYLIPVEARTMNERRNARRSSISDRAKITAEMVNQSNEQWIIWVDLNAEGDMLEGLIPDAIQVSGSDKDAAKESAMVRF